MFKLLYRLCKPTMSAGNRQSADTSMDLELDAAQRAMRRVGWPDKPALIIETKKYESGAVWLYFSAPVARWRVLRAKLYWWIVYNNDAKKMFGVVCDP